MRSGEKKWGALQRRDFMVEGSPALDKKVDQNWECLLRGGTLVSRVQTRRCIGR